jgi:hypothetical protein
MPTQKPSRSSWGAPSRKWWTATVVGLGTVGTAWAEADHWSKALTVTAVGLGVQRATAWLVPNANEGESDG